MRVNRLSPFATRALLATLLTLAALAPHASAADTRLELPLQDLINSPEAKAAGIDGSVRFYGLTPTSMKLEGLDRHLRLIESYKKLHSARANPPR